MTNQIKKRLKELTNYEKKEIMRQAKQFLEYKELNNYLFDYLYDVGVEAVINSKNDDELKRAHLALLTVSTLRNLLEAVAEEAYGVFDGD